tara:strand:- start:73 stop:249 length:177 start_codon:yes stop_codon:yes gene_type:complete
MDCYSNLLYPIYHLPLRQPLIKKISAAERGEKFKNDLWKRKISEKNRDLDGRRLIGIA